MSAWPGYQSVKKVYALPIAEVQEVGHERFIWVINNGVRQRFIPSEPGLASRAVVGAYAIIYEDGFRSISPADIFNKGHRRI
jgi:hypothetical protein